MMSKDAAVAYPLNAGAYVGLEQQATSTRCLAGKRVSRPGRPGRGYRLA